MKLSIEEIASVCYEVNRRYCAGLGDYSQAEWELCEQWQRDSAINGVKYHIANPSALESDAHNAWLADKIANGWKFGAVKNAETKEHPCCVAYDELSIEQKMKDYLFIAVAKSLTKI